MVYLFYNIVIMSKPLMPIREYLQGEFNAAVNETAGEDPLEAYVRLETALGERALRYDTYAQATITSGGHARNPNLAWIDIVKNNVAYAQSMAQHLYETDELNPAHTLEASTLGLINHWKESDYISFWLYTLARPDVTGKGVSARVNKLRKQLKNELDKHHIDLDTFNNYKKDAADRAPYYFRLADAYADAINNTDHNPVERLVAVSETAGSLGANTERYFAKKLGIKVYGLAIAQLGNIVLPADYGQPLLVKDTESIVAYGGQIFDPTPETRILLVKQG